jgi:hypothetical protein
MLKLLWLAEELYEQVEDILDALANGTYYKDPPRDNFPEPNAFDSAYAGGGD